MLTQPNKESKRFNAIYFNISKENCNKNNFDKIVFKLQWNRFKNKKTPQLIIQNVDVNIG